MKCASLIIVAAVALGLAVAGCSGLNAYRSVDLSQDLGRQDLERYEKEWQAAKAEGGMGVIENTDTWPLGILFYWDRGTVMRMGTEPVEYHVRSTSGVGPLSALYVLETHSTYNGAGQLMSTMTMSSVLWGHLAMSHSSEVVLPNGRRQKTHSYHLLHHLINIHTTDGHTTFSLLSSPNILGVGTHDPAAGHSGH